MKSPFTGKEMKLMSERQTVSFKKQEIGYMHRAFLCEESGEKFTTTELDELNLKQIQNVYRELNNIPFPDEIRNLRSKYGISAAKMSDLFGFGPNQYTLYENGEIPSSSNAKALNLALDPLVFKKMLEENKDLFKDKEYLNLHAKVMQEMSFDPWDILEDYLMGESKPDSFSGFKIPDYEKLANMVVFFAKEIEPQKTAMNKDLFYADFSHYKKYSQSISGCRYAAIPMGPVPNNFNSLFERMEKEGFIRINQVQYPNGYIGEQFLPEREFDEKLFLDEEIETLKMISSNFKNLSTRQLVDMSHEEKGWIENEEKRDLIDYSYALDLINI
ncbi:type II TA system antitoxin MqsA family protein [Chryseobacterium koreense]